MYCVECGKEGKLYEKLCVECFTRKTKFFKIPNVVKITICSNCFAWEKAHHWESSTSEEDAIRNRLGGQISKKDGVKYFNLSLDLMPYKTNTYRAKLHISGMYDDLKVNDNLETELRIKYGMCGRCSRHSGSYFEAKIQVRSSKRALDKSELDKAEKIVNEVLNRLQSVESNAFLTKSELIHGGEDFYIGSSSAAAQIAKRMVKEFAGKLKESSTLMGRKDGREIYRITYNIRIPKYKPGDFIKLNDRVYNILNFSKKHILGLDVQSGITQTFSHKTLAAGKFLGGSEIIRDAVVVLETDSEVQILDPDNYQTVDLIKPKGFIVNDETVKIIKAEDYIFLLPNLTQNKPDKKVKPKKQLKPKD